MSNAATKITVASLTAIACAITVRQSADLVCYVQRASTGAAYNVTAVRFGMAADGTETRRYSSPRIVPGVFRCGDNVAPGPEGVAEVREAVAAAFAELAA